MPADDAHPFRRNIIIFGDVGSGKSSLINLIGGAPEAIISGGVKSCTLQSQRHTAQLGHVEFALYDTAGMHEAQEKIGSAQYLEVIFQAHKLISELEQSGGISLLVFCMRGGRITTTTQHTYNLFVDVLCNSRVPVVIAVTHLEMVQPMENWWKENEGNIAEYGLRSDGHACLTATRGLECALDAKYTESREVVRRLLLDHCDRISWNEERAGWVKRVAIHMRQWLSLGIFETHDLKKKLMKRCGFSATDADAVARKIFQARWDAQTLPKSSPIKCTPSEDHDGKSSYEEKATITSSTDGSNSHNPIFRMFQVRHH